MAELIPLGQTNVLVSRLGLGAMVWGKPTGLSRLAPAQTAYGPSDSTAEEERALAVSISAGVNFVDTAEFYSGGASEARGGELTQGLDVVVATKFPPHISSRADDFPAALQRSLAALRRDRIDLIQHHFPSNGVPIPQLMAHMADAVDAGLLRAVGVSNYSEPQMRLAHAELAKRGIPLASNQVEYSLLHREPEVNGVLDTCRELGVTLIAYTPLAGGALTGKYTPGSKARGLRRFLGNRFRRSGLEAIQPVIALLREIGDRYGMTPNQVALRWLIDASGALPIPGAKNEQQAASNAGALSFTLTSDEVAAIGDATRAWRK